MERLARDPSADCDLAELSLGLARDEYPTLETTSYLQKIDELADRLRPTLGGSLAGDVEKLSDLLFIQENFRGDKERFYDPENSYLNRVIDRKLGLPITLATLAVAVGSRAGMQVEGVGLPGHFIARAVEGPQVVLFDPFHLGRRLTVADCEELVEKATGQPFEASADSLASTPAGPVLRRMLSNLKSVYLRQNDFQRGARVIRRLLQLEPGNAPERRDLGVCLMHAGKPGEAIDLLQDYLDAIPRATDAAIVHRLLTIARSEVAKWN